jgi:prolyl-tRNA editing enzyme YbaK/EbsC (Cys-tRNA(Pro) deacylase)
VKASLSVKDLKFASRESVLSLLGVEVGAVPPFGYLCGLPEYVDKALTESAQIAFNPGVHTRSIIMSVSDFQRLTDLPLGDYSVPDNA